MRDFRHPFPNADHCLAMLTVGRWIAQAKNKSQYLLALIFPLAMMFGIGQGLHDYFSPPMVAAFAYLHGFVHGIEMDKALHLLYEGKLVRTADAGITSHGIYLLSLKS